LQMNSERGRRGSCKPMLRAVKTANINAVQ
jgi:hypothetical protein